jgi:general secretion pathway protein F
MTNDFRPLPLAARAGLFAHLATMEQAGLPADKAFALLRLPGAGQARLDAARKLIARGVDIADAGSRSGLFSHVEARCVRAALHAGSPLATYRRLAASHAERVQLASTFKARMLVPLLVLFIAVSLRPLPSLIIGTIGMSHYVAQVALPLLALAAIYRLAVDLPHWRDTLATPAAGLRIDAALLRMPVIGTLIERANLRDFVEHLAILLEAGVPMFDALPLAQETMSSSAIRTEHAAVVDAVRAGATLAAALRKVRHPGSDHLVDVVLAGEKSGRLPEALFRHAASEGAALSLHYAQLAAWLPRLLYALLLAWIGYGILSSKAFMPGGGMVP